MSSDKDKRVIEAVLFASSDPQTQTQLSQYVSGGADIRDTLKDLRSDYEERGINLIEIDGKWAFRTAIDLADSLNIEKLVHKKLSRAAMETLAIIAYHQPVTRAEIENIRGVGTHRGTLDALMDMSWVKPGRRRETLGRPLTWVTTTDFLDHFSLESLIDLPGMDEMKASGLLDRRPAIDTINQDDLFAPDGEGSSSGSGQEDEIRVEQDMMQGLQGEV